jgi:hypothetical protein
MGQHDACVSADLGFFSFTEVPAEHDRDYDRWHRLDHLPEQFAIPGVVWGERWTIGDDRVTTDDGLARCRYLTLYLMREPLAETLARFRHLAAELRDAGRFFEHRTPHLAGGFDVVDRWAAPHALVRPEVVPWRPATGAFVAVGSAPAAVGVDGVAGAWTFRTSVAHTHPTWPTRDATITVAWFDGDPVATAARIDPGDVEFAASLVKLGAA